MDNNTDSFSLGVGGASISRFDDINPEDIESIEVLKGPAASALYGTAAANGVIQITTKRGAGGRTQWRFFGQYGNQWNPVNYGDNYYNVGTTPTGALYTSQCTLDRATQGVCNQGTLAQFNPAKFYNVYTTGNIKSYGLSMSGGGDNTQYYISGDGDRQVGAISVNQTHNYSLRANVTAHLTPKLNATFTSNYIDRAVRLPDNDNDIYGPLGNILLGRRSTARPRTTTPIHWRRNVARIPSATAFIPRLRLRSTSATIRSTRSDSWAARRPRGSRLPGSRASAKQAWTWTTFWSGHISPRM